MGAERKIVQNAVFFRGKRHDNKKFESANFIAEKFCCHRAGSYQEAMLSKQHSARLQFSGADFPIKFGECQISVMCKWTRPFWGDRLSEGTQKPLFGPGNPPFAALALRELKSACRVSIFRDAVTVPTVCFQGFCGGSPEGVSSSSRPKPSASMCLYGKLGSFYCRFLLATARNSSSPSRWPKCAWFPG